MSPSDGGNLYEYQNGVLRNKLDIRDAEQLKQVEAALSALRILELHAHPLTRHFDLDHLKAIHAFIFQDLYTWAGELRQVDIIKDASRFAHFAFLESQADTLFASLAQEHHLQGLSLEQFATRAAYYLGELNALHPFREGNGRTQRLFISALAREAGFQIDWTSVSAEQMKSASILSLFRADNSEFEALLMSALSSLPNEQP
jgi:cell filamentation protein, protein adenylyltransferase